MHQQPFGGAFKSGHFRISSHLPFDAYETLHQAGREGIFPFWLPTSVANQKECSKAPGSLILPPSLESRKEFPNV